jgi:hypothetical protein
MDRRDSTRVEGYLMLPMAHLPFNRTVAFLVLLTFCFTVGCSAWRGMPTADVVSDEAESLVGKRVKLYMRGGVQEMTVKKVESPYIEGVSSAADSIRIRVHLREVQRIEVYRKSTRVGLLRLGRLALVVLVALVFVRSIAR